MTNRITLLGIDLGGTKLAFAVFTGEGKLAGKEAHSVGQLKGREIGSLIREITGRLLQTYPEICSIGISVPGIYRREKGTVWAPNLEGWDDYPLLAELRETAGKIPVTIDSDRTCYILGECWKGNARGSRDAIFLAVGTGIGAGIIIDGTPLRGSHDIAGCAGWLALTPPFSPSYRACGCLESQASGQGIVKEALRRLEMNPAYSGSLKNKSPETLQTADVFKACEEKDELAVAVIRQCIELWGMTAANLVSLFNPEKIIFGGGVFGPARRFIPDIIAESTKWAQPIGMQQCSIGATALDGDAGLFGAGFLASKNAVSR